HRLIDRDRLGATNERRVHGGDARSDGALLGRGTSAGNDDLAEVHGADVEHDGADVIVAGVNGDCLLDWLIADAARLDCARSYRNGQQGEFTLLACKDAKACPGNGDLRLGNASPGDAIGDATADGPGRCLPRKPRGVGEEEGDRER